MADLTPERIAELRALQFQPVDEEVLRRMRLAWPALLDAYEERDRLVALLREYREVHVTPDLCACDPDGPGRCDLCQRTDAALRPYEETT